MPPQGTSKNSTTRNQRAEGRESSFFQQVYAFYLDSLELTVAMVVVIQPSNGISGSSLTLSCQEFWLPSPLIFKGICRKNFHPEFWNFCKHLIHICPLLGNLEYICASNNLPKRQGGNQIAFCPNSVCWEAVGSL